MSYCRFSTDSFRSDVYVYGNVSGAWTIHVAANRHKRDGLPEDPPLPVGEKSESAWQEWADGHRAFMEALDEAGHEAIALPHAGETFDCEDPGHAATILEILQTLGYHVPEGVIETLKEEQREMDSEEEL